LKPLQCSLSARPERLQKQGSLPRNHGCCQSNEELISQRAPISNGTKKLKRTSAGELERSSEAKKKID
jgi:hypothetical protein